MILDLPRRTEHIGAVKLHDVQKVYELDSGSRKFTTKAREAVATISTNDIEKVNRRMAIVIPIKNEKLKLLEGVLSGIPHDCHVIVVSGSTRSPVDRFMMETNLIKEFNHYVEDKILLIHQQDPGLSDAFNSIGFDSILGKDGLIRQGKAESMYIGILMAKMLDKNYVGFIDADNYIPGAVHEYVEIYAAGFILAESSYSMVRVSWVYKPKIVENKMVFSKWGRVSEISGRYLNDVIESYTGFGTEIVKTSNAGEHAISIKLADLLCYASGFAIETYELINILEKFGGIIPTNYSKVMSTGVDVFQIETRNPHLHEEKGNKHRDNMLLASLGAIYHSPICPNNIKEKIIAVYGKEPPVTVNIMPPSEINNRRFIKAMREKCETLTEFE